MFEETGADEPSDRLDWIVGGVGVVTTLLFVVALVGAKGAVTGLAADVNGFLWEDLGMLYLVAMFAFAVFALALLVLPWGSYRLGDADPEYSYPVYFAMVFSAGIAAGIVFWGPSEAIFHFTGESTPPYVGADPGTGGAALGAVQYTMFHWGFSPWAAYAVLGIPIAYYAYNYDAPLRVSTVLAPVVGLDNLDGGLAKLVDVLAVFATLGGLTTTLGLISQQFLKGTGYQFGTQAGTLGLVAVIGGFTLIFAVSVVTGVHRGIKRIALVNVSLFGLVALVTFVLGPTAAIVEGTAAAFGSYLVEFPLMSLFNGNSGGGAAGLVGAGGWVGGWTVFYWAWWFSWAPFVGLFMARVSKGRTVREVVVTGVVAPTVATLAWFGIMGNTAIHFQRTGAVDFNQLSDVQSLAAYPLFGALPFGELLVVAFLGTAITWLVTSADTATLSLSMLTTYGADDPPTNVRVMWAGIVGLVAMAVITAGGANALRQTAIITGGPFALIALVSMLGTILEFTGQRGVSVAEKTPDRSEPTGGEAEESAD